MCDKSYDRVSLASPISFRSQPGQTYLFVWHRRGGRDIRFGIFQGQAQRPSQTAAPAGGKASKRGLSAEQIPIIVARDRTGATLDAVLPRLDAVSIVAALGGAIAPSTDFCCDGGSAITAFARRAKLKLHVLPAPGNPKPEAPEHHINNVNAYHGRTQRMGPALPRREPREWGLINVSIFSTKNMRFGLRSDSSRFCPCRYQATVARGFREDAAGGRGDD